MLPALQLDIKLPTGGTVDADLNEKADVRDAALLMLLNDASMSSQQLLTDLATCVLPCRAFAARVSCRRPETNFDLAAFNF